MTEKRRGKASPRHRLPQPGRIVEDVDFIVVDADAGVGMREVDWRWATQSRSVIGQTKKIQQQRIRCTPATVHLSAARPGSRHELPESDGAGRTAGRGHARSHEDDADWPATTMAARCWGRSARATTTVARDGATPSILHGERGEGGEVARRREKTRSAA